jgi:hypothetical protein
MKNYSIIRVGDDYVVQVDEKSVLKTASRRMATKLVAEASELLDSCSAPQIVPEAGTEPSIACDRSKVS